MIITMMMMMMKMTMIIGGTIIIILIMITTIIAAIVTIIFAWAEPVFHPSPGACRDISRTKVARKKEAIAYFSMESALALLISLFINLCVVSVFAKGFYGKGAGDIGLKNAGDYLGERFGSHMVREINSRTEQMNSLSCISYSYARLCLLAMSEVCCVCWICMLHSKRHLLTCCCATSA